MQVVLCALLAAVAAGAPAVEFGMYDYEKQPAGGWLLMSGSDFEQHKAAFVKSYNDNQGVKPITVFQSGNCCFAVKGGLKLTISGTPYEYQFPASRSGGIRCNPTGGYNEVTYQFYRAATLSTDQTFGSKAACATSHNPAIWMKMAPAEETEEQTTKVAFGMYDYTLAPTGGWKLMDAQDFTEHAAEFIAEYNANGIKVLKTFRSGNCCFAVAGGEKLTISNTPYDFQFPSTVAGQISCSPAEGYTAPAYKFYKVDQLDAGSMTFGSKTACITNHNPGIFVRLPTAAPHPDSAGKGESILFGLYDREENPGEGWSVMTIKDFQTYKHEFVTHYNENGGLSVVKSFQSGNCCVAVASGLKLTISGTPYGYQFPASTDGGIRCNPTGGYTESKYMFYRAPKLDESAAFTEKAACATSHNPAVFFKIMQEKEEYEFGLFNREVSPGGGWELMSIDDFNAHKQTFVDDYNARKGVRIIRPFQSGNCCVAIKNGKKLIISDTAYGYQFPASRAGGIRCNPTGGYTEEVYQFYRAPSLATTQIFSERDACATSNNPAIFMRVKAAWTDPTTTTTTTTTPPAVHCETSHWGAWSMCTATCGTGQRTRTRHIMQESAHGGDACPELEDRESCLEQDCPIHCDVTDWGSWGQCNAPCGGGTETRDRTIAVEPKHNGDQCPNLSETRSCNVSPCPVHCQVTDFSDWSGCNALCGGGTKTRMRSIVVDAEFDGTPCPHLQETQECGTNPCPVHCLVSDWGAWPTGPGSCDAECGGGNRHRTRSIIVAAQFNGDECPTLQDSSACNTHPCPVHCQVGNWSGWGPCDLTCGGGTRERERVITVEPQFAGDACPALVSTETCNASPCPVDCQVTAWSQFSACSKTCGSGTRTRARTVFTAVQHGGKACPVLEESQDCKDRECPVHCEMASWGLWGPCSTTCGAGTQLRSRSIITTHAHGGDECPGLTETRECPNAIACPQDCVVSAWGTFSACTKSCGAGGLKERTRSVVAQPADGGAACPMVLEGQSCNEGPCPVHCDTSSWSTWSACTKTCGVGGGTQSRSRSITTHADHGGYVCPTLEESQTCNKFACPVDCTQTDWGAWTACTLTCGAAGQQMRVRSVTRHPSSGGVGCGHSTETQACNVQPCPIDCVVGDWASWTACTKSCGGGHATRSRSVTTAAAHGGVACQPLSHTMACNEQACPVDCDQSDWGGWGACSHTCGESQHFRMRITISGPQHGGKACGPTGEDKTCNLGPCPIHCEVSSFTNWTGCSKTCGGGEQVRTRTVLTHPLHGGNACLHLNETQSCSTAPCPVDCVVSDFGEWSACSKTCGGGFRVRTRQLETHPNHGGVACPGFTETAVCNTMPCPVHCNVSSWSAYGSCTKSCGGGVRTRSRDLVKEAAHGGTTCPSLTQTDECNTHLCPVNCEVSDFGPWSNCTETCGGGEQLRVRVELSAAAHGGAACGALEETRSCATGPCPVHCAVTDWGAWAACSASCGGGTKTRSRSVTTHADHGGYVCPTLSDSADCGISSCPIDCELSDWAGWSACSATCGGGLESRTRSQLVAPQHGGVACESLSESRACGTDACPVHCEVGDWGTFGSCSLTCGSGSRTRTRAVKTHMEHGGYICPHLSETEACNTQACPVNCAVSEWASWSTCPVTCGGGIQVHTRSVTTSPNFYGSPCPSLREERSCGTTTCPIDCVVSSFTPWTACTKTCGGGTQSRSRTVATVPQHGGVACPSLSESQSCGTGTCPVDCAVSDWSSWAVCSLSCGGGTQKRTRSTVIQAASGGVACPTLQEMQVCNSHECPIDCVAGTFGAWGSCSLTCGGGVQTRSRPVTTAPANGGKPCTGMSETQACSVAPCPVDCAVSDWDDWGECSATCRTGVAIRSRTITQEADHGGVACPHLSETKTCDRGNCPVHCQVTEWGSWSPCSLSCGTGSHTHTRTIVRHPDAGGYVCPDLSETLACNEHPCPEDCIVGPWLGWSTCSKTCGGGTRKRTRTLVQEATHGGACMPLEQLDSCNVVPCPIDCVLSDWGKWGTCSAECDGGVQKRTRTVITQPNFGGAACGDLEGQQRCGMRLCDKSDQKPCSHISCEYKKHPNEAVMNYPETHGWNIFRPHTSEDDALGKHSTFRQRGQRWHVSVKHSKYERHGGKHYCHNVGHHMPKAGGDTQDKPWGWNEVKDGQSCVCICWDKLSAPARHRARDEHFQKQRAARGTSWDPYTPPPDDAPDGTAFSGL